MSGGRFTASEDEQLIELVHGHPIIWNLIEKDYKNVVKKDVIWSEIGKIMKRTGLHSVKREGVKMEAGEESVGGQLKAESEDSHFEGLCHIEVKAELDLGAPDEAAEEEEIFPMEGLHSVKVEAGEESVGGQLKAESEDSHFEGLLSHIQVKEELDLGAPDEAAEEEEEISPMEGLLSHIQVKAELDLGAPDEAAEEEEIFPMEGLHSVKVEAGEESVGGQLKAESEDSHFEGLLSHIQVKEELDLGAPDEAAEEEEEISPMEGLHSVKRERVKVEAGEESVGGQLKAESEDSHFEGLCHIQVKEELDLGAPDEAAEEEEILPVEVGRSEQVDPLAYSRDCSFSCHHCGFTTPVFKILKNHLRNRRKDQCPISCPQCTLSCTEYSTLREHLQSWHLLDDGSLLHSDRDQSSAHSSDVKPHIPSSQSTDCFPSSPYWDHNYSRFQHSVSTWHIIRRLETVRSYCCPLCNFTSALRCNLERHIMSAHTNERPYSCPHCEYSCVQQSYLKAHIMARHTSERPYSCPHCKYSCVRQSHLNRHIMARHTNERPYCCPHCEFSFVRQPDLKKHIMARHTSERPYSCPHCKHSCVRQSHLKEHIMTHHTNERPYSCPHCEYTCVQPSFLKQHIMARHTNERTYSCPHCEYSCTQRVSLKNHIMARHTHEHPYSCPHCNYTCILKTHLKIHIMARHTKERPHSCPHCEYSCVQQSHLKTHIMARHTKERPYSCVHCEYSCVRQVQLQNHIIAHHTHERP